MDTETGQLRGGRITIPTPVPATPAAVASIVETIAAEFASGGAIGVTFPGVVRAGVIGSAANVDRAWIGLDAGRLLAQRLGRMVVVLNDADGAGTTEMTFGAGRGRRGVVMSITLGTGIGTALFVDGVLVPNTEFGHIIVSGVDGERLAAASVRTSENLSWVAWADRLSAYLARLENLIALDLIILGGAISAHHDRFLPLLRASAEILPARLLNDAGIVGAALAAARLDA